MITSVPYITSCYCNNDAISAVGIQHLTSYDSNVGGVTYALTHAHEHNTKISGPAEDSLQPWHEVPLQAWHVFMPAECMFN